MRWVRCPDCGELILEELQLEHIIEMEHDEHHIHEGEEIASPGWY